MSVRFASDMASACGSSITGLSVVLSQRGNAKPLAPYAITLDDDADQCPENGTRTLAIFIHHPQRNLYEVYYARCVGTPRGRLPPSALGMVADKWSQARRSRRRHPQVQNKVGRDVGLRSQAKKTPWPREYASEAAAGSFMLVDAALTCSTFELPRNVGSNASVICVLPLILRLAKHSSRSDPSLFHCAPCCHVQPCPVEYVGVAPTTRKYRHRGM